ncbi:hypothetical protein FBU30_007847 [Linnemannia zychae]|nr:hypothetical protein FBU30_007847 [Linnemannia zychae]
MDNKLQQKFALVQQMKKEKELKEASRVKDRRSVDIFALAGVNLPKTKTLSSTTSAGASGPGQVQQSRIDGRHGPPTKKPRVQSNPTAGPLSPSHSVTSPRRENEETSNGSTTTGTATPSNNTVSGIVTEKKLKRSSMAARNIGFTTIPQANLHGQTSDSHEKMDNSAYRGRGRNSSISSMSSPPYTSTPGHHSSDSNHGTPPTPIPSPRTDLSANTDNVRQVETQVSSRRPSGSTDSREEMGRAPHDQLLRPIRHKSPEAISDYHNKNHETRKRRMDSHNDLEHHPEDRNGHRPRIRSNSRSRSRSPGRQGVRSYSRSVSPYKDHGPEIYKRRDSARDFEQDYHHQSHHDSYSSTSRYPEMPSLHSKIRVEGLAETISVRALLAAFGPYGEIEEANLVEGKDYAFVTYTRMEAAQRALDMMNGSKVEGAVVRVFREECPIYYQRGSGSEAGILSPLPSRDGTRRPSLATSTSSASSQRLMISETTTSTRPIHQLPPRPRSPKLPPKPVTAVYPPVGADPQAAVAQARGRGRQLLSYGDL